MHQQTEPTIGEDRWRVMRTQVPDAVALYLCTLTQGLQLRYELRVDVVLILLATPPTTAPRMRIARPKPTHKCIHGSKAKMGSEPPQPEGCDAHHGTTHLQNRPREEEVHVATSNKRTKTPMRDRSPRLANPFRGEGSRGARRKSDRTTSWCRPTSESGQ